jgi:hypothetical protein
MMPDLNNIQTYNNMLKLYIFNKKHYSLLKGGGDEDEKDPNPDPDKDPNPNPDPVQVIYSTYKMTLPDGETNLYTLIETICNTQQIRPDLIPEIMATTSPIYSVKDGDLLAEKFITKFVHLSGVFFKNLDKIKETIKSISIPVTHTSGIVDTRTVFDVNLYFVRNLGLALIHDYCWKWFSDRDASWYDKTYDGESRMKEKEVTFIVSQILESLFIYLSPNYRIVNTCYTGDIYDESTNTFYEVKSSKYGYDSRIKKEKKRIAEKQESLTEDLKALDNELKSLVEERESLDKEQKIIDGEMGSLDNEKKVLDNEKTRLKNIKRPDRDVKNRREISKTAIEKHDKKLEKHNKKQTLHDDKVNELAKRHKDIVDVKNLKIEEYSVIGDSAFKIHPKYVLSHCFYLYSSTHMPNSILKLNFTKESFLKQQSSEMVEMFIDMQQFSRLIYCCFGALTTILTIEEQIADNARRDNNRLVFTDKINKTDPYEIVEPNSGIPNHRPRIEQSRYIPDITKWYTTDNIVLDLFRYLQKHPD